MVPPASNKVSRASSYSGFPPDHHQVQIQDFHLLWFDFPDNSFVNDFLYAGPTTPTIFLMLVWALIRVRSPLLAESLLITFPPGTEMFHFPGFAPTQLLDLLRGFQYLY